MTLSEALRTDAEDITTKAQAVALLVALGKEWAKDEGEVYRRMARRELALAKDINRRKAGKAARLYLPTVPDALGKGKVAQAVKALVAVAPRAEPVKTTPRRVKRKAAPPAKPAPVQRKARAKPVKLARPAVDPTPPAPVLPAAPPVAKPPTVRKASPKPAAPPAAPPVQPAPAKPTPKAAEEYTVVDGKLVQV